jgi:hypothetical protein
MMEVDSFAEELSGEEEAELCRSNKRVKDGDGVHSHAAKSDGLSYKDKLVGCFPGAFEQAFFGDDLMEDPDISDNEEDVPEDGNVLVYKISRELKQRIRAPWVTSLIVKVFGRSVGYHYLHQRIHSMWNPTGSLECIDLGHDFFLVRFEKPEDFQFVLRYGPWFVGNHFLAIRKWEPNFRASSASLSSVAVWVRIPGLPIEYYDQEALLRLGRLIGPVLRVDAHTYMGSRGRFARICVQVNLDKPLKTLIKMDGLEQPLLYEGISSLCFICGRLGHRKENCPYQVKPPSQDEQPFLKEVSPGQSSSQEFGAWVLVGDRKKKKGAAIRQEQQKVSNKGRQVLQGDNSHFPQGKSDKFRRAQSKAPINSSRCVDALPSSVDLRISDSKLILDSAPLALSLGAESSLILNHSLTSSGFKTPTALVTNVGTHHSKSATSSFHTNSSDSPNIISSALASDGVGGNSQWQRTRGRRGTPPDHSGRPTLYHGLVQHGSHAGMEDDICQRSEGPLDRSVSPLRRTTGLSTNPVVEFPGGTPSSSGGTNPFMGVSCGVKEITEVHLKSIRQLKSSFASSETRSEKTVSGQHNIPSLQGESPCSQLSGSGLHSPQPSTYRKVLSAARSRGAKPYDYPDTSASDRGGSSSQSRMVNHDGVRVSAGDQPHSS